MKTVEDLKYDLKIDGLTVYINYKGNAASNISNHVRTKLDMPSGSIIEHIEELFNCVIDKFDTIYTFTFKSERDMMFFILHT